MKKLILSFIAIACCLDTVQAQDLKVISATEQGESFGPAGSDVCHYHIRLSSPCKGIVFDSAYLDGMGVKIGEVNAHEKSDTTQPDYTILADVAPYYLKRAYGIRTYVGEALIIYEYKGQKFSFIIKRLQRLPSIGNERP